MKEIRGNMKKYVKNMKEFGSLSHHIGSGTWKNSELPPRLWDLEKIRFIALFIGPPGEEIETKSYPWDFSPIFNVIVTQLSPCSPGDLGVTRG